MNRRISRALAALIVLVGGTGIGLLAAPAAMAAPHHVAGDFDGDGVVDLAVGAPGGNRVRISYSHAHPGGSHTAYLHPSVASHVYSMQFGWAIATADFDNDGYADLAVGAPNFTTPPVGDGVLETRGAIFVYLGSSHGLVAQPLTITGPYDGDEPYNLADTLAAYDVDGDGYADLASDLRGTDDGNIRIYHGSSTGLAAAGYDELDDYDATALAFGDVNGDHHIDLIAGSTTDLTNPVDYFIGDVMIFHGTAAGINPSGPQLIRGDQVGVFRDLGTAVAAGDINHDGYDDVVVGAAYDREEGVHPSAGTIVVLTGSSTGLSASRRQLINESAVYAHSHDGNGFGGALAIAKITGDAYADLVVGAPTERVSGKSEAGAVYVLRGSATGVTLAHRQRFTAATPGVPGSVSTHAHFGAVAVRPQAQRRRVRGPGDRRS